MKTITLTEAQFNNIISKSLKKLIKENNDIDIINLAIKKFGLTSNIRQAGYILPNGTFLNFGSYGERETDHRAIEAIYKENNIPIWNTDYRYNYVVDFMNHGAIRCDVNTGLLDMTQQPTQQQYKTLKMFARYTDEIYLDFTDKQGNNIHSVEYDNPKPQQLVTDIYNFYNNNIKPSNNIITEKQNINKNFNTWKNTFDGYLKQMTDELQTEYLNKLNLKININPNYMFNGGKNKWLAAYERRTRQIKNNIISVAINYPLLYKKMCQLNVDKDEFNIEAQARITIGHEIGHGIVDYIKNLKLEQSLLPKMPNVLEIKKTNPQKEEYIVEEFGEYLFPKAQDNGIA